MTAVLPGLLLGTADDAADRALLDRLGVTHVVNATTHVPMHFAPALQYHAVPVCDVPEADLAPLLPAAVDFIASARAAGGTVLVHCLAGVSRSAAVVLAYLVASQRWPLAQALAHLRNLRPTVSPNLGFMGQLVAWDKQQQQCRLGDDCGDFSENNAENAARHLPMEAQPIRLC